MVEYSDFVLKSKLFKIRKANEDDHQAVSSLQRNVYGGCDYVPGIFKSWIAKESMHKCLVVTFENEVIGFFSYSFYTLKDITMYVLQGKNKKQQAKRRSLGSRIRPDFNGLGLNTYMHEWARVLKYHEF